MQAAERMFYIYQTLADCRQALEDCDQNLGQVCQSNMETWKK